MAMRGIPLELSTVGRADLSAPEIPGAYGVTALTPVRAARRSARQPEPKRRSSERRRRHHDVTPVQPRHHAGDRQAETGAARRSGAVEAHEPLEDPLAVAGADAGPGVLDDHGRRTVL